MFRKIKYLSAVSGNTEEIAFENFKKTQMYCPYNYYTVVWDDYWNHFVIYQFKNSSK